MSHAALDDLIARGRALVAALDADDVAAIECATAALREAVACVRAIGGPRDAARADEALAVTDAARARVVFLADVTRARLRRIAATTGREQGQTYGRTGRLGD